jgi:hypothetical protein
MDRRTFLRAAALGGAALAVPHAAFGLGRDLSSAARLPVSRVAATAEDVPRTGFEQRDGASWTTHDEELAFLAAVAAAAPERMRVEVIGHSLDERPLHQVTLGLPAAPHARHDDRPTVLFVGSQHGNEPAGREAVLIALRDLALTAEPQVLAQLAQQTVLVVPSANPDGRARNTRGNAAGIDINRDHLALTTPETQAIHRVIRDWAPDTILDHHEYGPGVPVLYDADILYLWPRNLNVDAGVRDLSRTLCEEYIAKGARAGGYTADVYGLYKIGPNEVTQTAGDEDEGICRNAVGLRHHLGVLIESAVSQSVTGERGLDEVLESAANNRRRVSSQVQTVVDTLRFLRDQGHLARHATASAPALAAAAGAERTRPTYFGGADNQPPTASQIDFPPPVRYDLTPAQAAALTGTFTLHGIQSAPVGDVVQVPMGQAARPVIPLLLDGRGRRRVTSGTPVYDD